MDRIHRVQSCFKISFYTIILLWPLLKVITLESPFRGYTIKSMNIPEPTCLQCSATVVRQYVISRHLWYLWCWWKWWQKTGRIVWKILSLFVSVKGFRIQWPLGLCCVGFKVTQSSLGQFSQRVAMSSCHIVPSSCNFFLAMKQSERLQAPSPGLAQLWTTQWTTHDRKFSN